MKYSIEIVETLNRIVAVEAKSEEQAVEKVKKMYFDEEIVLDWNDMTAPVEFNVL